MSGDVDRLTTQMEGSKDGHRTYKSVYRVKVPNLTDGPITAYQSVGLPTAGSAYSWGGDVDLYALALPIPEVVPEHPVTGTDVRRKNYLVTVTHTTDHGRFCNSSSIELPWAQPWDVENDADEWVEEAYVDSAGDPFVNSSQEPFVGKVAERFHTRRRYTLSKNFQSLNESLVSSTEGTVNDDTVTILGTAYDARTLYMRKIRWTRKVYGVCTYFYPHTFQIDVNLDTHDFQIVDRGTREFIGSDYSDATQRANPANYRAIKDGNKHNIEPPGVPLKDGEIATAAQIPQTLTFEIYDEADWSSWSFPT